MNNKFVYAFAKSRVTGINISEAFRTALFANHRHGKFTYNIFIEYIAKNAIHDNGSERIMYIYDNRI